MSRKRENGYTLDDFTVADEESGVDYCTSASEWTDTSSDSDSSTDSSSGSDSEGSAPEALELAMAAQTPQKTVPPVPPRPPVARELLLDEETPKRALYDAKKGKTPKTGPKRDPKRALRHSQNAA
jgi:hypothetical protein